MRLASLPMTMTAITGWPGIYLKPSHPEPFSGLMSPLFGTSQDMRWHDFWCNFS